MPTAARACLRCIERKRKCDHNRPQCGFCSRLAAVCEYPLPQQRRGPLGGFSRLAETRAVACENALAFLLVQPAVRDCLANLDDKEVVLPQILDGNLSKESRSAWWASHPLDSVSDLLIYPVDTQQLETSRNPSSTAKQKRSRQPAIDEGTSSSESTGSSSTRDQSAEMKEIEPSFVNIQPTSSTLSRLPPQFLPHQDRISEPVAAAPPAYPEYPLASLYDSDHASSPQLQTYDDGSNSVEEAGDNMVGSPYDMGSNTRALHQQSYTPKLDTLATWSAQMPTTNLPLQYHEIERDLNFYGATVHGIRESNTRHIRDAPTYIRRTTTMPDLFW